MTGHGGQESGRSTRRRGVRAKPQPDLSLRALRVLELLAAMNQPATLMSVAAAAELSKASAYRVLRNLQDEGYIDHIGRAGYKIGGRSLALASVIGPRPPFLSRALPVLTRLAAIASETATLHLRSGSHRVLILKADPPIAGRCRQVHLGERAPLLSGCTGTAILAHLPQTELEQTIPSDLPPTARRNLTHELGRIRSDGYAMSFSAGHSGTNGIASALLDPDDAYPLGSIGVGGSEERLSEASLRTFAAPLRAACLLLSPQLAVVLGPHSSLPLESLNLFGS